MSQSEGTGDAEERRPAVRVDTEEIVAAYRKGAITERTAQNRYLKWRRGQQTPIEYLLPRSFRDVVRRWPGYMDAPSGHADLSAAELRQRVTALGPWSVPYRFARGVASIDLDSKLGRESVANHLYRRALINDTVEDSLGDDFAHSSVLDLGCNAGWFTLDLAARGALHVDGVDLRPENIARAEFAREHFGIANAAFAVSDADDLRGGRQWDVVCNLGVLYHVMNPLDLLRGTYELCRRFAIVDTVVHLEPVSAYFLFGDKDVAHASEGREGCELHPTYRGAIETLMFAGFREVVEIVGRGEPAHPLYAAGGRRCFLAIK